MMLLDLISNLPRLRLSSAHFKLILWLLRDSGVPNVPSYYAFQQMKAELQKTCGSEPQPFKSVVGNYFYVNDPRDAVKKVRKNFVSYILQLNFAEFCKSSICKVYELLSRRSRRANI